MVNMFTGGAFSNMTIFALGIMPFISAQIIIQMLTIVIPALEKLKNEGQIGQRKINRLTRYGTIVLTAFQAFGLSFWLMNPGDGPGFKVDAVGSSLFIFTTVVAMTTGTAFIMWLGEQITEYGIGNGISLIISVGIIAVYPTSIVAVGQSLNAGAIAPIWLPVAIVMLLGVSLAIIYIQEGARRLPIQQAKRVVGRRVMGGTSNVLPLKVNTAGVIPVIFSSAIMQLPSLLLAGASGGGQPGFWSNLSEFFAMESTYNVYAVFQYFGLEQQGIFLLLKSVNAYVILYALLTGFFCFFYTAVTFNPLDIADNLKKSGSFIPGYRPGKPTAQYIDHVLTRITVIGSVFLVGVALIPYILMISYNMPQYLYHFVGGTGLIIVVGVTLQFVQSLEAQLVTYNYEGFRVKRRRRNELASTPVKGGLLGGDKRGATKPVKRERTGAGKRPTRGHDRPAPQGEA
jgi:preprotein translocase subunit SecY